MKARAAETKLLSVEEKSLYLWLDKWGMKTWIFLMHG